MITPAHREQYAALTSLGINRQTAIGMIARQIKKSLPTIDTSEADQRREDREEQERQNTRSRKGKDRKDKGRSNGITLKTKPRKEGDTRPTSPTTSILQKLDGTKWLRVVAADGKLQIKQLDKYFVPTFVEARDDNKTEPTKSEDKGDQKEMKKSQRFEKLVQIARANPQRLTPLTLTTLNAHLAKTGQPAIPTPQPSTPQIKNPVTGTSYSRMTAKEHQQFLLDQALQRQAESEANKTPEVKATWYAGDQPTFRIV